MKTREPRASLKRTSHAVEPIRPATPSQKKLGAAVLQTEVRNILATGSNIAINQLAQIVIPVTSVIMTAWLGVQSLAAGNLVNSIALLLYLTSLGILQGSMPLIGSGVGAGNNALVIAATRASLVIAVVLGLVTTALMAMVPAMLHFTGQEPQLVALSGSYVWWLLPGYVPGLLFLALRFFLISIHDLRWLNPITCAGILCNVACNYAFMYGVLGLPVIGLGGIGLSAALTNWLMFILTVAALVISKKARAFLTPSVSADRTWRVLREILSIGIPIGMILFIETMLFTGSSLLMGYVGTIELAAHGLVLTWLNIALMLPVGLSQAAVARVAFQIGQRSPEGVKQAAKVTIGFAMAFSAVIGFLFAAFPQELIKLLLWQGVPANEAVLAAGAEYLRIAAITQLLAGLVIVQAGVLRGTSDTTAASWIVAVGYWGAGLGAAALAAFLGRSGVGIWFGISFGFLVSLATLQLRFSKTLNGLPSIIENLRERHDQYR